jgi:hypothetical protein
MYLKLSLRYCFLTASRYRLHASVQKSIYQHSRPYAVSLLTPTMNQISSPWVKRAGVRADEDLNKYGLDNSQRRRTEHSVWNRSGSTPSLAGIIMCDHMVPSFIQNFHSRNLLAEDILLPSCELLWLMYYMLTSCHVFCCVARNSTLFLKS